MKKSTLMLTAVLICIAAAASDAAVITWTDPVPVISASDVRTEGTLVEAVNGHTTAIADSVTTTSPTVNGVVFTGSKDFLEPGDTTLEFDFHNSDTGDSGYNDLLSTVDLGGGGDKFTKSLGGGNLVSGNDYLIQIWFVDDRPGYDTRVMEYGDGNGNTVQLTSGDVTYAIGTFTADGTTQDLTFDAIGFGNAHITAYQIRRAAVRGLIRSFAHSPLPDGADIVDPTVYSSVSWYNGEQDENGDFLDDPNIVSIDGYDVWWSITEPNFLTDLVSVNQPGQSYTPTPAITYDTTYYWRVDSYVTWDSNDFTGTASLSSVVQGLPWSFTTEVEDNVPVVTLDRYVTWPDELPYVLVADVNDFGEDDIDLVEWEITSGPGIAVPGDMEMQNRTAELDNIQPPYEPNLLRDWIGTDLKVPDSTSNVLNLTLSGLPAGSYTWTSYHYDAQRFAGTLPLPAFDVTVTDSAGATTTTDVPQSNGLTTEFPPAAFTTTITSDGSDVTLQFVGPADYRALADADDPDKHAGLFAMNAFELTGSGDPLYVDFGSDPNFVEAGYQGYLATNGDPETFIDKDFGAFGTTVTVTPDWNAPGLAITSTGGTLLAPTATVDTTDAPQVLGNYNIKVTATEDTLDGNEPQVGSTTKLFKVVEDACAAAQVTSGFEFDYYDVDENCIVNLADFAAFAAKWLDDASLSETTPY